MTILRSHSDAYLGGFCLACPSRSSWCTTKAVRQGCSECHVTSVSQCCDYKTPIYTHVFVSISECARALSNADVIRLALPVESELRFPGKLPTNKTI